MFNQLTHFEVYGEQPEILAHFYEKIFDWQLDKMEGLNYWRVSLPQPEVSSFNGGLTFRSIPGLNGFLLYANVASVDETVEKILHLGGSVVRQKTAIPRTAWVTIVSDPDKNIFGIWQSDPKAFPMPEPD